MLFALASFAHAAPLSFDAAVREALDRGPAAGIAAAAADRDRATATAGASVVNPSGSVERIASETEIRLQVPLPASAWAAQRQAAAFRDAASVRAGLGRALAGLDAGRAYLDTERALEQAQLAADTLALAMRRADAARRMLDAQEIGRVDAAAADAEAARAISASSLAAQEALRSRVALELALGRVPSGTVDLGDWPELAVPEDVDPIVLPAAIEAADNARAARAARARARLDLVPTPALTAGWRTSPTDSGVVLGVDLALPLFSPGVASARAASAEADRASLAAARVGAQQRGLWLVAVAEAEAAETAYLATDASRLRGALTELADALASGGLSLADYVARRDALVGGLEAAIDARYRLEVARLDLWTLAGRLPPEVLP